MAMEPRFVRWTVGFVSIMLAVLVISLISVIGAYFFVNKSDSISEYDLYDYQRLDVSKDGSVSRKIVSIHERLDDDEFKYHEKEGKHYVISNFGRTEYICTGTCSCVDYDRRASGRVLASGVSYLVVALTSVLALQVGKRSFEEYCAGEYDDVCDSSAIVAELDDCFEAFPIENEKKKRYKVEEGEVYAHDFVEEEEEDEVSEGGKYNCFGKCVKNTNFRNDFRSQVSSDEVAEEVDHKLIDMDCDEYEMRGFVGSSEIDFSGVSDTVDEQKIATDHFSRNYLDAYCRANSIRKVGKGEDFAMCVGITQGVGGGGYWVVHDENICKKIGKWHWANWRIFKSIVNKPTGCGSSG